MFSSLEFGVIAFAVTVCVLLSLTKCDTCDAEYMFSRRDK
jgi:hypothetical protein